MNDYKKIYKLWTESDFFSETDRKELLNISDEKEIEDRFYKDLEFGTGGLRGVMGIGSNRMNEYTVRKAAMGFAQFLINEYKDDAFKKGIAIAYDTRNNSKLFAEKAALTITSLGVPVYLFDRVSATPLLSFAVRFLGCIGGIVITASHNTKEYNGFKAYDRYGCQLCLEDAEKAISFINKIDITAASQLSNDEAKEKGLLKYVGDEVLDAYSKAVINAVPKVDDEDIKKLKLVYTPLHGSGNVSVRKVLEDFGFNFDIVKDQELPDGNFPTVKSPNPGNPDALNMAIDLGEKLDADLVVGSDPDADRAGIAIRHNGKLEFLDGNSMGALMLYYLLERYGNDLPKNPKFITTIVSGELAQSIARENGISVDTVLTGFKFIGELMTKYENDSNTNFIFGCEESYGFVAGNYVRDKCAAFAILLICTAAAYYLSKGKTLGDVMDDIHEKYGFFQDNLDSYVFKGKEGAEKMAYLTKKLRSEKSSLFENVREIKDYAEGIDGLPKSDVLKFFFNDGSWIAIRPSGTEPQIKVYYSTKAATKEKADELYQNRKKVADQFFK